MSCTILPGVLLGENVQSSLQNSETALGSGMLLLIPAGFDLPNTFVHFKSFRESVTISYLTTIYFFNS